MTIKLHGLVAATHTPFDACGQLNLAAVEQQVEHLLRNGVNIAFIGGSTGESHSLTVEERLSLNRRWSEVIHGTRMKLVVHVGSNCLADTRRLSSAAESLGADAISALSPSYFKPKSLETLIAVCAEVASAASGTPFYFYDIPVMTGVSFSMSDFLAAAPERLPTLAGIKFTNSDMMAYQKCLRVGEGRFDIPWGMDEYLLGALSFGAMGAVGSTYNFAAPIYHRVIEAFKRGDLESARTEQFRSVQLIELLASYGYMGAAKATMGYLGVDVGLARLPNSNLTTDQSTKLRAELEKLGFFEWVSAESTI